VNGESGSSGAGGAGEWLYLCCDGAARGNPGPAGIGGQAMDSSGRVMVEVHEFLGEATNNVAEYHALIRILEAAADLGFDRVKIMTDSELVAGQITGGFRVKSKALRPLLEKIQQLLAGFSRVEVEHIPREKNIACDALANRAIDEGLAGLKKPILKPEGGALF